MIRFPQLEELGIHAAVMTGVEDGDCAGEAGVAWLKTFLSDSGVTASSIRMPKQVHGTTICSLDELDQSPECDGVCSAERGAVLAIRVADCVPVYLLDSRQGAAALVHAGWRGTLDGIAGEAVRQLQTRYGSEPADIHAVIGASACPNCYEVSPELAERFSTAGLATRGRFVNLWESNALQLRRAGVQGMRIHNIERCTICENDFFSHRRQATSARNLALLVL